VTTVRVDLSRTVIFMTSNLGSAEITELLHGGMGFVQPEDQATTGLEVKVARTAVGSGAEEVLAGIHESPRQDRGVSSVAS